MGRTDEPVEGEAAAAVAQARMERKSLEPGFVILPEPDETFDPGPDEIGTLELRISVAMEALLARQADAIASRLRDKQARRGTPYWVPAGPDDPSAGDGAIDLARVMDGPRWAAEAQEALMPVLAVGAQESSASLLEAMAASGVLAGATVSGASMLGEAAQAPRATSEQIAAAAATTAAPAVMLALTTTLHALGEWMEDNAGDLEKTMIEWATPDLQTLVDTVRMMWAERSPKFIDSVAVTAAQTVIGGARDSVLDTLTPGASTDPVAEGDWRTIEVEPEVVRVWRTREDENVRVTHRDAQGQRVGVREPFTIGDYEVRYPSDPMAPPSVARHCRCWIKYEWTSGVTFHLPPLAV